MKIQSNKRFLIYILLSTVSSYFSACAFVGPTKPNLPYAGNQSPSILNELARENPLLVQELGKLPELQDEISNTDLMALSRICRTYNQNRKDFDSAFEKMYDVGYPNVRKFCTPLQALYWMALKDKLERIDISNYTLITLLSEAWYKSGFELDGTGRWDDFGDVTERLNDPRLVDYYEIRNFSYHKIRLGSTEEYQDPHNIFRWKQGECWLYTAFSVYCLKKAGYQAHAITVYHGNSGFPSHVTCAFIDKDGKEYILDNSISAFIRRTGIYKKKGYLDIYPYFGKGYLTH